MQRREHTQRFTQLKTIQRVASKGNEGKEWLRRLKVLAAFLKSI